MSGFHELTIMRRNKVRKVMSQTPKHNSLKGWPTTVLLQYKIIEVLVGETTNSQIQDAMFLSEHFQLTQLSCHLSCRPTRTSRVYSYKQRFG